MLLNILSTCLIRCIPKKFVTSIINPIGRKRHDFGYSFSDSHISLAANIEYSMSPHPTTEIKSTIDVNVKLNNQ